MWAVQGWFESTESQASGFLKWDFKKSCLFSVYVCAWVCRILWKSEEGLRFPQNGVIGSREPPYGYWESNPGPLQDEWALLAAEASCQPNTTLSVALPLADCSRLQVCSGLTVCSQLYCSLSSLMMSRRQGQTPRFYPWAQQRRSAMLE